MRLIDADRLKNTLIGLMNTSSPVPSDNDCAIDGMLNLLDAQPTVDAVKHGYWYIISHSSMFKNRICRCSICRCDRTFDDDTWLDPFCPECGAKMDEKEGVNNG